MGTLLGRTSVRAASRALAMVVLGLLVGACGTDGGESTAALSVESTASTDAPVRSVRPTVEPPESSSPSPLTVLAIGDSFVAWSSWPELYANAVESALGRPTELDTSLAAGGASPRLDVIRGDPRAHARIHAADVIVVQPEPGFAAAPMSAYLAETCGGDANTACFATAADDYRTYVAEYLDLITSLSTDQTAIRVVLTGTWGIDGFHPRLREEDPATRHDLIALVDELMAVVESEAQARSIPVIDVNTAFNGPDHRQPAPDDYLVADRLHLDDAGSVVVAQLLAEAGFAPLGGNGR